MLLLKGVSILFTLPFTTVATPNHFSALQPRNDSLTAPLTPGIEATITSPTGDDLTTNFQILLYESPQQQEEVVSNLTDRQVALVRPLNFCRSPTQIFSHSLCNYHYRHAPGSPFQQYVIWCRDNSPASTPTYRRLVSQLGACNDGEICINNAGEQDRGKHNTVAKCVARSLFKPLLQREHTDEEKRRFIANLTGMSAATLLTQTDGITPLKVERLEVDAGVAEDGAVESNKTCTSCFNLATPKLGLGTDFLKTQATLSAAGAVTAGIVFLAVLSG